MFGDQVIFGGFIELMRRAWPRTRLVLVAPDVRRHLYEFCPHLDETIFFDWKTTTNSKKLRAELYTRIRATHPDYIISSQFTRCAMTDRIMRYCPARVRLGVTGHNPQVSPKQRRFDRYYTHLLNIPDFQPSRTETRVCQMVLDMLHIPSEGCQPRVWTSANDVAFAEKTFRESGFAPERTLIFFSGSSSKLRSYPPLKDLTAGLLRDGPWSIIVVGGKDEYPHGEPPDESLRPRWLNLCGLCTIRESAELMRRSRLVLGVETGLAQVACAVGVPHVLLQSGAYFGRFLPAGPQSSVVILPLSCYFCLAECPYDQAYCLTQIPAYVFRRAVEDALAGPSARARVYLPQPAPEIISETSTRPQPHWQDDWVDSRHVEIIPVPLFDSVRS
jgi:ADP-heptose:LPS heptosyltransferase